MKKQLIILCIVGMFIMSSLLSVSAVNTVKMNDNAFDENNQYGGIEPSVIGVTNETTFSKVWNFNREKTFGLDKSIKSIQASIQDIDVRCKLFSNCKENYISKCLTMSGIDFKISSYPYNDQNPEIISDNTNDLLSIWDMDMASSPYYIGVRYCKQNSWSILHNFNLYFLDEILSPPRLDYYADKTAYATCVSDFVQLRFSFEDITEPPWQGNWVDWIGTNMGPFTSTDVGCYSTSNPPFSGFWGIFGLTGHETDEWNDDNMIILGWEEVNAGLFALIALSKPYDFDFYNISVDIDQSNGQLYLASDFVDENDPSNKGILIITKKITPNYYWFNGNWYCVGVPNDSKLHVDAKDGRVYVVAEGRFLNGGGNKDIECWTTITPEDITSWEGSLVTNTPSDDEMNPVITAHSDTEATVVYTKNNNLYFKTTTDSGYTWSQEKQINDQSGSVVEQYACADIVDSYVVWTDNRNGDNDIYFDNIIGNQPPNAPTITGPPSGNAGTSYTYTFTSTDPDADLVKYYIDWGDGNTEWTDDFSASGTPVTVSHTWAEKGTYTITVKAQDEYGLEGPETTLTIRMPKNKAFNFNFNLLSWLFEQFPNAFPKLRYILGL